MIQSRTGTGFQVKIDDLVAIANPTGFAGQTAHYGVSQRRIFPSQIYFKTATRS